MSGRVRLVTVLMLAAALMISSAAAGFAETSVSTGAERVRVFIGFTSTPGPAEEAMVRSVGGTIRYRYHLIPAIAAELPRAALDSLAGNPRVTLIEPVLTVHALDYQQELDNTWGVKRIGAGTVHAGGQFGAGVKVAVIDTGIDYTHPELKDIYVGGWNFVNNSGDPMDDNGHGTHVAGTIAAARDGRGVVGVAPGVQLYALKVLGADGSGTFDSVIAAVEWAVDNGIQVTNNSYGSQTDPGTLVRQAFDRAYAAGILHVGSAGNSGNPPGRGDNVGFPAKYESVIAVAATGTSDQRASFSSTGQALELSAPGVSINSTVPGGGYGLASGTSMAAPHVAGAAALVWSAYPDWTNEDVRARLRATAIPLGSHNHYGFGLIDAVAAVGPVDTPAYTITVGAEPADGGSVSGGGQYAGGSEATVSAAANSGWVFVNWTEDGSVVSESSSYTFEVTGDRSLVANFTVGDSVPEYTITVSAEPADGGSVSGAGQYAGGSEATVSAAANSGWVFVNWTEDGSVVSESSSYTFEVTGDRSLVANFEPEPPPPDGVVSVTAIEYSTSGGRLQDRHLHILVFVSSEGAPVAGATVTCELWLDGSLLATLSGTTTSNGTVSFTRNNAPSGVYATTVLDVQASGLTWDGVTPDNGFSK